MNDYKMKSRRKYITTCCINCKEESSIFFQGLCPNCWFLLEEYVYKVWCRTENRFGIYSVEVEVHASSEEVALETAKKIIKRDKYSVIYVKEFGI